MVSISIFIGVLGVVTILTIRSLLFAALYESYSEDKLPMIWAWTKPDDDVSPEDIDNAAVLETLRAYPDVTAVEGGNYSRLFWKGSDDYGFLKGFLWGFSEDWDALQLEPTSLVEGDYPVAGQQEVAISWQMAERHDFAVGDSIVIRLLSRLADDLEYTAEIPEETWTITGIVHHPYVFDRFDGQSGIYHSVYVNFEDFAYITGIPHFGFFKVQFTAFAIVEEWLDDSSIDLFERGIFKTIDAETSYQMNGVSITNPATNGTIVSNRDGANVLSVLGFLAMLVASFLAVTVVSTIITEQKRQIGVMKSLGAKRLDNFLIYTGLAAGYGFIGAVPGVLLGVPIGYYVTKTMIMPMSDMVMPPFIFPWSAVIIGLALGVLMPFFASIIPVFLGTRVTILSAINDFGISATYGRGRGFGPRLIHLLPVPVFVRQALANIYQRKCRLMMTGITLTLTIAVFVGISAVFVSMRDVLNDAFDVFNYELEMDIVSPSGEDYGQDAVKALITENIDGVIGVYPRQGAGFKLSAINGVALPNDEYQQLSGFDPAGDSILLDLQTGRGWEDDPTRSGAVLTEITANDLGVEVGDTLTFTDDDRSQELEVLGTISFPEPGLFVDWQVVSYLLDREPNGYLVQLADETLTGADVDRIIADTQEKLLHYGIITNFNNRLAMNEEANKNLGTIASVFSIASVIMTAIGAVGLLAMLSISVLERQREIGVMRVVGASSRNVAGQFLVEGLLVGVIAWLVALPLSYGIGYGLTQALPFSNFGFNYPVFTALLGLVGMVVIATLASLGPSISASRKTVSNILRYQ
jgi:putative ABC transport system permease protein